MGERLVRYCDYCGAEENVMRHLVEVEAWSYGVCFRCNVDVCSKCQSKAKIPPFVVTAKASAKYVKL